VRFACPCADRGHLSRPRGRAVDRASVRKRNHVRQLAPRRQVAGDIPIVGCEATKLLAHVFMWIEDQCPQLSLVSDESKRCGEINVSAYDDKCIGGAANDIGHHFSSKVYIRTFLDRAVYEAVVHLIAALAWLCGKRKLNPESFVEAFYDLDLWESFKDIKVAVLVECGLRVCGIILDSGREVFDGDDIMFFQTREQGCCETLKIEPLARGRIFQQTMIKVKAINIEDCLFLLHNCFPKRQEPDLRPALHRIAVAQRVVSNPSRGSVGSVPHRRAWRKGGREKRYKMLMLRPRPSRIEASPRIGRASRSDINPLTGSACSLTNHRTQRNGECEQR